MAELNAFANKLEKELTCSICEEIFTNPRTLRCLHSFCLDCISAWNESCKRQTQPLSCPSCRSLERLEGNDVSSLPPSFHLQPQLQLLNDMRIAADKQERQGASDYVNCSIQTTQTELNAFNSECKEKHDERAMAKIVSDEEERKDQQMTRFLENLRKLKTMREKEQKKQNYEEQQEIENIAGPSIKGQKIRDDKASLSQRPPVKIFNSEGNDVIGRIRIRRFQAFPEKPSIVSSKPVAEHCNASVCSSKAQFTQSVTDRSLSSDLQRLDDISNSTRQECDQLPDIDLSEENWWFGSIDSLQCLLNHRKLCRKILMLHSLHMVVLFRASKKRFLKRVLQNDEKSTCKEAQTAHQ